MWRVCSCDPTTTRRPGGRPVIDGQREREVEQERTLLARRDRNATGGGRKRSDALVRPGGGVACHTFLERPVPGQRAVEVV